MSIEARKEYLKTIRERYSRSKKSEKSLILDEFCQVCNYSRKYAIRVLRGGTHSSPKRPGFMEADTVAHCGTSLAGQFAWTLTMTDLYSGWTENSAVWTKESYPILMAIKDIDNNLPFGLHGFASDNGNIKRVWFSK